MRLPLALALFSWGCTGVALPTPTPPTTVPGPSITLSATPPPTHNLLFNPGFEEDWYQKEFAQQRRFLLLQASDVGMGEPDGIPDHWQLADSSRQWQTLQPHSGERCLGLEGPGVVSQRLRWVGENGWQVGGAHYGGFLPMAAPLAQNLRRRPLVVGAWCRTRGAPKPPRLRVELLQQQRPGFEAQPLGAASSVVKMVEFEGGDHDWQYRELTLNPPAQGPPIHFVVIHLEANGGQVWFDDASVVEQPGPDEVNLIPYGGFEVVTGDGRPGGWSPPQLWRWFRNEYYTFTGWTHEHSQKFRGQARLDPIVHFRGRSALRFEVYPGDNFAVSSQPIRLAQRHPQPLEVRAMVRADDLRTLEIMAQDQSGQWLPQGDFLGDDMENNPSLYNMGTSGSGSYDWICLRKFFSPRQPVSSLKLLLCARGYDGVRLERNRVGLAWWDDIQLYQHGEAAPAPELQMPGKAAHGLATRASLDLGERLWGDNLLRLSAPARGTLECIDGQGITQTVSGELQTGLNYRLNKLCQPGQFGRLKLTIPNQGETLRAEYPFGTPSQLLECQVDKYFAYPGESLAVRRQVHVTRSELSKLQVECSLPSPLTASQGKLHPWDQPQRDRIIQLRALREGKLLAQSQPVAVGFLHPPPPAQFPAVIQSTRVNSRGYLEINGKPYLPVYFTPNFERPFEGNYPPRLFGCPSLDLNGMKRADVLNKVAEARRNPRFFAYELGDGEMQLQGPGWPLRLQACREAMGWVREVDPNHLINGPESWLVGHPGHQQAMKALMPYFDVIGVETSFEEVPQAREAAAPGHACAVLAGLEAYYYQPVESLRWRAYRALYEGCAGVGLCPSEMLKASPAHVNYLRGLNAEFRGLESVLTAPEPADKVRLEGPALSLERHFQGQHTLVVMCPPGASGGSLTFHGVRATAVQVRGEGRSLPVVQGVAKDTLTAPHGVHVYQW